jgi:hypothetical protein
VQSTLETVQEYEKRCVRWAVETMYVEEIAIGSVEAIQPRWLEWSTPKELACQCLEVCAGKPPCR